MQLFNLHYCRFLPFVFLLIRSITPNLSGNDHDNHDNDAKVAVSPLLDGSNSPIAMSQNAPEAGQGWPADALFKTDAPFPVVIATDQADDVCSIPPIKEYSQRRRFKRGNACTAPPEPKPRPGNNDGAPKTPENRINPHSGPSFESVPSWKEPNKLPFGSEKCPDPLLNNPVCAFRAPDMTNWVERQYPGITVDLPECYMCMFQAPIPFPSPSSREGISCTCPVLHERGAAAARKIYKYHRSYGK